MYPYGSIMHRSDGDRWPMPSHHPTPPFSPFRAGVVMLREEQNAALTASSWVSDERSCVCAAAPHAHPRDACEAQISFQIPCRTCHISCSGFHSCLQLIELVRSTMQATAGMRRGPLDKGVPLDNNAPPAARKRPCIAGFTLANRLVFIVKQPECSCHKCPQGPLGL